MLRQFISLLIVVNIVSFAWANDEVSKDNENDYKWMQFNLWHAIDRKPHGPNGYQDTFLELEFGTRSGFFDLYGYIDVFDIGNSSNSDAHDGSNLFMKLAPRFSLNSLTGKELSTGFIKEVYVSNLNNVSDPMFDSYIGLGADVDMPVLGMMRMNLYARYAFDNMIFVEEEGKWNGYQFSMSWFTPFYFLENGSYISYQGYLDWLFDVSDYGNELIAEQGGVMSNGIFWHSDKYAVGYSLDYVYDGYLVKDSQQMESTGFTHYFTVSYKL